MENSPSAVAHCATHPEAVSHGVCARCGNYVCERCTESGAYTVCPTCRERDAIPFPFTRERWSTRGLTKHAYRCFKADRKLLLGATIFTGLLFMLGGAAQAGVQVLFFGVPTKPVYPLPYGLLAVTSATSCIVNLILTPMLVGFIRICLDRLRGRELKFATLFTPFSQFLPIAILVVLSSLLGFVINVVAGAFLPPSNSLIGSVKTLGLVNLPILVVAFYVGLGVAFTYAVLADDPKVDAFAALKRSWQLADGQRLGMFALSLTCGLIIVVGMFLCFLPVVVAAPVASLAWAGCYLALTRSEQTLVPTPSQGEG